jgi:hypothetical protein
MTMIRSAPKTDSRPSPERGPSERLQRLHRRQRLFREELLVVLILLLALAVTVTVLGMQWLDSGPSTSGINVPHPIHTLLGGPT